MFSTCSHPVWGLQYTVSIPSLAVIDGITIINDCLCVIVITPIGYNSETETEQKKHIGNAVPVHVPRMLMTAIYKANLSK